MVIHQRFALLQGHAHVSAHTYTHTHMRPHTHTQSAIHTHLHMLSEGRRRWSHGTGRQTIRLSSLVRLVSYVYLKRRNTCVSALQSRLVDIGYALWPVVGAVHITQTWQVTYLYIYNGHSKNIPIIQWYVFFLSFVSLLYNSSKLCSSY